MTTTSIPTSVNLDVNGRLQNCHVVLLSRENTKIAIHYELPTHDGQITPRTVMFKIKPDFLDTIEEYDRQARGGWGPNRRLPLPADIIEGTKVAFASDEYYRRRLTFYENDIEEQEPEIGEPKEDAGADYEKEQREQEEAYAS